MSDVYIDIATGDRVRELILEMNGAELSEYHDDVLKAINGPEATIWVGYIDGAPVCAWGLVPPTLLSDRAYLWLYTSPKVEAYKFLFVRYSQRIMEDLRQTYPLIYGVCNIHNDRAIRWLKWLGASFGDPGVQFIPFYIGAA